MKNGVVRCQVLLCRAPVFILLQWYFLDFHFMIRVHGPLNSRCPGSSKPPKYVSDQPTATLLRCPLGYDAQGSTASSPPWLSLRHLLCPPRLRPPLSMPAHRTPWPWPLLLPLTPPSGMAPSAFASVSTSSYTMGIALPSLTAILHSYIPTLQQVPKGARDDWAKTFNACLSVVTQDLTNLLLWAKLFMLPKCVLVSPGAGHRLAWREILQRVRTHLRR